MDMESSPGNCFPLSSLRLLVPPLRLVSAWMWQVAEQRNIMHYGKLEEFVTLVTEMVPDLLSYKRRAQLILGLRARLVLELCCGESPADFQTIQPHLDRISQSAEPHGGNRDPEVETAQGNFVELIQTLLKNTEDRTHFFQDVFPEQYGPKYDTALQILVWEFLSRLEQLLPVPDFKQTASWLGDDVSSVWEDSLQSVSNPEYLKDLLQYNQCLGHLKKAHSCNSIMGDTILSTLSCPPTVRVVIGLNEEANSVGSNSDEDECLEAGAVNNSLPERDRDVGGGLTDEGEDEEEGGGKRMWQNEESIQGTIDTHYPEDIQGRNLRSSHIEPQESEGMGRTSLPSGSTLEKRSEIKASSATTQLHTCSQCGKSLTTSASLRRHEKIHTGERPFNCIKCEKDFITAWDLTKHQRTHSLTYKRKSHSCSCCGKTWISLSALKRHEKIHTGERPFGCIKCGKKFITAWDLTKHQRIHSSIQYSKSHSCSHCGRTCSSSAQLKTHERIHTGERPFNCTKCEKSFNTAWDLSRHLFTHTAERPFACTECGKTYRNAGSLKAHWRLHTGERPYVCSHCGRGFVQSDTLKAHIRTHTGERPHSCPVCGRKFIQSTLLRRHLRMHTGEKPYLCETCGKTFPCSGEMTVHKRIHTGERPYRCEQCGKSFRVSCALNMHRRVHTGERPHPCPQCGKCFFSNSDLKCHLRVHTGEKPYQCSTCGKRFADSSNMKIHQRVHRRA